MRWARFFRRRYWDEERSRELEAYVEIETDENISRGMAPDDARHKARKKLGNSTLIREYVYRMNSLGFIETLWQDVRHGARLLRLNPGFASVAILSLALGIGANTSIFQLLDAIRLRALPVKNPQELVEVQLANRDWTSGSFSGYRPALTNPLWEQLRDRQQAFTGMFAWGGGLKFNLSQGGESRLAEGMWVSGEFFNVLGIAPVAGRVFTISEDRRGCGAPGAVISYAFWQREFGGDPAAIGRTLLLSGNPFEVIGVTPAGFSGVDVGKSFDIALPLCSEPVFQHGRSLLDQRHQFFLAAMGRLKPGWSVTQASAHLASISPGIFEATVPTGYASDMKDYLTLKLGAFEAGNGVSGLREASARPLWLLMSITGLVLLIACANLANLMLARASAREKEIAVRLAIGASRARLIRQLLAESLLLAAIGTVVGACVAPTLSRLLISLLGTEGNQVALKRTIAEQSPDIILQFQVFKTMLREKLVTDRVMAALSGAFGFLAAMLAMIGLYGVMSYMVARRRSEIGIRIALGADRRDVMAIILREAGLLLAIGLVVGTGLSLAAATTARKLLFGLEPNDPKTLAMAIGSLAVVALAASYVPALRAARLDPMVALRDE